MTTERPLNAELLRLQRADWIVQQSAHKGGLPAQLVARYLWLPEAVRSFLCDYDVVCRADQKMWLLSCADYADASDSAYRWNEWELQSLDAAKNDEAWRQEIREFWDRHLPISLSLADGYRYYALRSDGMVVTGREPEFEETTPVAASFTEFLQQLR